MTTTSQHVRRRVAGLLAIAVVAACAAPTAALSASSSVSAKLSDFKIGLSAPSAKPGRVTFVVRNVASDQHELVVIKTTRAAAKLPVKGDMASEAGSKGEVEVAAGTTRRLTLNLKAGHYALICNMPGHYKLGMHVDFTVR